MGAQRSLDRRLTRGAVLRVTLPHRRAVAASRSTSPINLAHYGYVEREFKMSGTTGIRYDYNQAVKAAQPTPVP